MPAFFGVMFFLVFTTSPTIIIMEMDICTQVLLHHIILLLKLQAGTEWNCMSEVMNMVCL